MLQKAATIVSLSGPEDKQIDKQDYGSAVLGSQ